MSVSENPLLQIDSLLERADSTIRELTHPSPDTTGDLPPVGKPIPNISDQEKRLLMDLTIDYWNDGNYRDVSYYQRQYPLLNIPNALENLESRLDTNGLPKYPQSKIQLDRDEPTPEFVVACNIVCDMNDKRGLASKLKDVQLSTRHWNALLNKKPNREYLKSRMDRVFDENLETNAKLSMGRLIESGDLQAIRFYYEITHKYRPQETNNQNLQLILVTLMEVLAKYVSTDIMSQIADELDRRKLTTNPLIEIGA